MHGGRCTVAASGGGARAGQYTAASSTTAASRAARARGDLVSLVLTEAVDPDQGSRTRCRIVERNAEAV